ncbi:hypothetical protein O6H91_15G014200 [Diphasiastrum complanatum]|uniref:Uncharacterized protein n=1 Tax=Diphasiastrum complanatum TaxID=34168 RepID=A0ACC2BGZ0_DIPCM|nr:hypothetical protein O6H91_15G014200 [Diphasiastrum complanatum]
MSLPSGFESRIHEMEHTRKERLEVLQAEKDIQKSKRLNLRRQKMELRQVQQRCLLLKQMSSDLDIKIMENEDQRQTDKKRLRELLTTQRTLSNETEKMKARLKENSARYDSWISKMKKFQDEADCYESTLQLEIRRLKTAIQELESEIKHVQDAGSNWKEERDMLENQKEQLLSTKRALEIAVATKASARQALEKNLHKVREFQQQQKDSIALTFIKLQEELVSLQKENQSIEEKVFMAMRMRDLRRKYDTAIP